MGYPQLKRAPAVLDWRVNQLTTQRGARSNTALFRTGSNGHQTDLSTFENAARSSPRFSRAQSHARRAQGVAQPPCSRPASARAIAVAGGVKKHFGLDASRRLGRKVEFEGLLRSGTRRSLGGFVFYYRRRAEGPPRLGILISRKHAAAAVERNRIKRCIREAFRLEQHTLGALDLLVRPPYGVRGSPDLQRTLRKLLGELA